MFLALAPRLSSDFPEARITAISVHGLSGQTGWPVVDQEIAELTAEVATGKWQPRGEEHPAIASWHAAYRKFGTNPRRFRPSHDALERRLGKSSLFPRVLPAVDAYNLISIRHGFPAGAFNLASIQGNISIRYGQESDRFIGISSTDIEAPNLTEVVYADDADVLTRHWNHRDAQRTCVSAHSTSVLFLLESIDSEPAASALAAAAHDLARLIQPHAEHLSVATISADQLSTQINTSP